MKKQYQNVKAAYPVLISFDEASQRYLVHLPDFDSDTSGETLVEAIQMARDALSEEGLARQDLGLTIPEPSTNITPLPGQTLSLVDIDLAEYRKHTDTRTVKKTLSIPSYLNELGSERGVNFSLLLANALRHELHVK